MIDAARTEYNGGGTCARGQAVHLPVSSSKQGPSTHAHSNYNAASTIGEGTEQRPVQLKRTRDAVLSATCPRFARPSKRGAGDIFGGGGAACGG